MCALNYHRNEEYHKNYSVSEISFCMIFLYIWGAYIYIYIFPPRYEWINMFGVPLSHSGKIDQHPYLAPLLNSIRKICFKGNTLMNEMSYANVRIINLECL